MTARALTTKIAVLIGHLPRKDVPLRGGKGPRMTHVVAEPCFNCKYTDCVVVCPVECFYEGQSMLYIHPDECIDCEACVPECPVEAIFHEDNLPGEWADYKALNAELATQCPVITEKKESMAETGGECPHTPK